MAIKYRILGVVLAVGLLFAAGFAVAGEMRPSRGVSHIEKVAN